MFKVKCEEDHNDLYLSITRNDHTWTSIAIKNPKIEIPQIIAVLQRYLVNKFNQPDEAEAKIFKLRDALIGLVGAATKKELTGMELFLRSSQAPSTDIIAAINAVHILLETADE